MVALRGEVAEMEVIGNAMEWFWERMERVGVSWVVNGAVNVWMV